MAYPRRYEARRNDKRVQLCACGCGEEFVARFRGKEGWTQFIQGHQNRLPARRAELALAMRGEGNPMFGRRGEQAPSYGRKHTLEYRQRMSEFQQRPDNPFRTLDQRGNRNHEWKGGYAEYYGENWTAAKRLVRERDGQFCQECGRERTTEKQAFAIHHVKPIAYFPTKEEANDLSNLTTLCPKCHRQAHKHLREQGLTETSPRRVSRQRKSACERSTNQ